MRVLCLALAAIAPFALAAEDAPALRGADRQLQQQPWQQQAQGQPQQWNQGQQPQQWNQGQPQPQFQQQNNNWQQQPQQNWSPQQVQQWNQQHTEAFYFQGWAMVSTHTCVHRLPQRSVGQACSNLSYVHVSLKQHFLDYA
jgi:hypothetical protein